MALICEINEKTYEYSIEVIPLANLLAMDQLSLFKEVAGATGKIKNIYERSITRSRKIIGNERIKLVEAIDNLFIFLCIISDKIKNNAQISLENKDDLKIPLDNKMNKFYSSGQIKENDLFNIRDFNHSYQNLIVNKIKDLLVSFKNSIENNQIKSTSVSHIFKSIDSMLYYLIILRYNLKNCMIDK
jgi:hypothetical protein